MRALALAVVALAVVALAGCHDYGHFHDATDGAATADLAGASSDLAGGCPTPGPAPTVGTACTVYTFEAGVPSALTAIVNRPDSSIESACGMLHVQLGAGVSHDLWIDNLDSVRVEEKTPRSGAFTLSARVHGALVHDQQFSGLYAVDTMSRFISIQTSTDSAAGLHDHDVVFAYGAAAGEQGMYPTATVATGDSYGYTLRRMSDGTTFSLTGSTTTTLTVTAPSALTPGVVVGNCCGGGAPAFEAYVEWMMVCP